MLCPGGPGQLLAAAEPTGQGRRGGGGGRGQGRRGGGEEGEKLYSTSHYKLGFNILYTSRMQASGE